MKGIVTRATDIKPCIVVAAYACDVCGFEVYQVVNGREFNPKIECPSNKCVANKTNGQLQMQIKSSKFISFQELKIQEPSDQVPIGHVPRTLKVLCKGVNTKQCSPGDYVTITGCYLPAPFYGFKAIKAGLSHDTYLEAYELVKDKQNFKESLLTHDTLNQVYELQKKMESERALFHKLAGFICPEIFGMDEIKQALLLLMVGGNTREMSDGMKIRGNVNVLLMGDPGVAKS